MEMILRAGECGAESGCLRSRASSSGAKVHVVQWHYGRRLASACWLRYNLLAVAIAAAVRPLWMLNLLQ